jgi:hypothetical protein
LAVPLSPGAKGSVSQVLDGASDLAQGYGQAAMGAGAEATSAQAWPGEEASDTLPQSPLGPGQDLGEGPRARADGHKPFGENLVVHELPGEISFSDGLVGPSQDVRHRPGPGQETRDGPGVN